MTDLIKRWRELAATVEHDYGTVALTQDGVLNGRNEIVGCG